MSQPVVSSSALPQPPQFARSNQRTVIHAERHGAQQVIRLTTAPVAPTTQLAVRSQLQQQEQRWRLFLFWLIVVICVVGGSSIGGLWLMQRSPERTCQQLVPMRSTSERLYCQQVAVVSGNPEAGFAILQEVSQWPPDHPLSGEQSRILEEWSQWAFDRAQATLDQGDLNAAVLIARRIPRNSALAATAHDAIATWQDQWQQAELLELRFEEAIAAHQWQTALSLVYKLAQSPLIYWRTERTDVLLQRLRYTKAQYVVPSTEPIPEVKPVAPVIPPETVVP